MATSNGSATFGSRATIRSGSSCTKTCCASSAERDKNSLIGDYDNAVRIAAGQNSMLKIHHLGHSQSERIVWLCEELGVPYELVKYARDPVTRLSPPELKA